MKHVIPFLVRLLRCRRGNAMLEFAIGAGVMVSIFVGTFQFGYTFYQYNLLKNAVSDGAHYAALRTYDSATCQPSSAFQTAVQNMVVYGDPGGGSNSVTPGLTTGNVTVTPTCNNDTPTAMTVAINGYTISAVVASTTLTNKPTATYPYQGIDSPQ